MIICQLFTYPYIHKSAFILIFLFLKRIDKSTRHSTIINKSLKKHLEHCVIMGANVHGIKSRKYSEEIKTEHKSQLNLTKITVRR